MGEEPKIANVPTWRCLYEDEREHVLANIGDLVVKLLVAAIALLPYRVALSLIAPADAVHG